MNFDFTTILGIIGAVLILVAFALVEFKIWKTEMTRYDLVNFFGSAVLVYYGILIKGYPFVILNTIWALVSLRSIIIDILKMKKTV